MILRMELRTQARAALLEPSPARKVAQVDGLSAAWSSGAAVDPALRFDPLPGPPGRPARPRLVEPRRLPRRTAFDRAGRGALLHAVAHIEFNAINLALDACLALCAGHARSLLPRLAARSGGRGLPLHASWQATWPRWAMPMATFDAHDGLVVDDRAHGLGPHRTHGAGATHAGSARPGRHAAHAGAAAQGWRPPAPWKSWMSSCATRSVTWPVGNHWYRWLCVRDGLDPLTQYARLAAEHRAPRPRPPLNWDARRLAGFSERELQALSADQGSAED
jgi:hypothetical protein